MTMATAANGAAEARKRRKEIIQSQRGEVEGAVKAEIPAAEKEEKKAKKKKKFDEEAEAMAASEEAKRKTQIRYDPEVPMDKDQLAAWRREARRVRNRESAAASRQRIRSRIDELEDEVGEWKAKYQQAMERLASLQQSINADENSAAKN
jgi:chromosome segregation ATPase